MKDLAGQAGGKYSIRYLSARDVVSCMPPMARQLELAEAAVLALARGEGDNPPKTAIHTRDEAFLHAMPAYHRSTDRVGLKWVSGYPENRAHGLPYIMGLIVLNDPETGRPLCVMDAREITGVRTAAISGVAMTRLAPPEVASVAIVGTGVQARAHLPVLTHLFPPFDLVVCDVFPEAAEAFAAHARGDGAVRSVRIVGTITEAIETADLVVTAGTTYAHFQNLIRPELMKQDVLIVAVDWSTLVPGATAQVADLFVVDDVSQYLYHKGFGVEFQGYPDEARALGDLVVEGLTRDTRSAGLIIAMPLGVAMTDILYAHEVLSRAEGLGVGRELEA
jgi:ornithine cyclodeaminase/alanine dehydrogenase-like protein (mu-crystallin family)